MSIDDFPEEDRPMVSTLVAVVAGLIPFAQIAVEVRKHGMTLSWEPLPFDAHRFTLKDLASGEVVQTYDIGHD